MKKLLITLIATIAITLSSFPQTQGTMTFTFTQTAKTQGSCTANSSVIAVWVQDFSNGTLVKTRIRYVSTNHQTMLPYWANAACPSSSNATDALCDSTGNCGWGNALSNYSTPTAFGSKTIQWDGTDVNGNVVPDGTYKIYVESATYYPSGICNAAMALNFNTWVSLTKGPNFYTNSNPGNSLNITNWSIVWTPGTVTSLSDQSNKYEFLIYPNPSQGIFNIKSNSTIKNVKVLNILGETVYEDNAGTEILNLSNFNNGIYYISVNNKTQKIILNK